MEGNIYFSARVHVPNMLRGAFGEASKSDKGRILDEIQAATGVARSTARRLLSGPSVPGAQAHGQQHMRCDAPQLAHRRPRGCSRANPDDIKTPQQPRQASRPANRSPQTETSSSTVSISAGPFRVITARHNESASHVEPFASMHHQPRRRPHRQKTQRLTLSVGGTPPRYHAAVAPNRNEIRGHRRSRKKHLTVVPRHFILD